MARVRRHDDDDSKDISRYTDLGEMHWREALEKAYSPGIDTVAVCPEMMPLRGTKRLIPRHKTRDKVMVIYDREYVFYRLYSLFIKKLDIVTDGKLDDKRYQTIVDGIREYSLKEFQRQHDERIKTEASLLDAKFPGKGIQHWIRVLSDDMKEDKKEDDTTKTNDAIAVDNNEAVEEDTVTSNVERIKETQAINDVTATAINDVEIHTNEAIQTSIDVTDVTTDEGEINDRYTEDVVTGSAVDSGIESNELIGDKDSIVEERRKRGRPPRQD